MKPDDVAGSDAEARGSAETQEERQRPCEGEVQHGFVMVQEMFDHLHARITDLERRAAKRGGRLVTRYFARRRSDGVWAVHADGSADADAIAVSLSQEEAARLAARLSGASFDDAPRREEAVPAPPAATRTEATTAVQARAFGRVLDVLAHRAEEPPGRPPRF